MKYINLKKEKSGSGIFLAKDIYTQQEYTMIEGIIVLRKEVQEAFIIKEKDYKFL
jgi:hypothetical protein